MTECRLVRLYHDRIVHGTLGETPPTPSGSLPSHTITLSDIHDVEIVEDAFILTVKAKTNLRLNGSKHAAFPQAERKPDISGWTRRIGQLCSGSDDEKPKTPRFRPGWNSGRIDNDAETIADAVKPSRVRLKTMKSNIVAPTTSRPKKITTAKTFMADESPRTSATALSPLTTPRTPQTSATLETPRTPRTPRSPRSPRTPRSTASTAKAFVPAAAYKIPERMRSPQVKEPSYGRSDAAARSVNCKDFGYIHPTVAGKELHGTTFVVVKQMASNGWSRAVVSDKCAAKVRDTSLTRERVEIPEKITGAHAKRAVPHKVDVPISPKPNFVNDGYRMRERSSDRVASKITGQYNPPPRKDRRQVKISERSRSATPRGQSTPITGKVTSTQDVWTGLSSPRYGRRLRS